MNNITSSISYLHYASYAYHRDNGISASTMAKLKRWENGARLFERRYIEEKRPKGMWVSVVKVKSYPPEHGAMAA